MSTTSSPPNMTDIISPQVQSNLPPHYTIRHLEKSDYSNGFLDVLRVLTTVGDISQEAFDARYDEMTATSASSSSGQPGYFILVICNEDGKVVGTGALIVEKKFIHSLGKVGHVEDIAVAKDQQGKKLGLRMIQALDYVAEKIGCYKTILDCSEANEGFYIKCGYQRKGYQMAHYFS